MNYKATFRNLYNRLDLSQHEIDSEIDFVLEMLFDLSPKDFILGKSLTEVQKQQVTEILTQRVKTDKPLQQIIGRAYFAGDKFFVSSDTLIPRPETEFIINVCQNNCLNKKPKIIDIGTGSGCIAIELAKVFPQAMVDGVDISVSALEIAKKNAVFHNVSDRVNFYQSDVFSNVSEKFDILVSNPPYIPFSDIQQVQSNVYKYEPKTALFAEDDGLFFYKKIISEAKNYLNKNALIVFECGVHQAEKIAEIFKQNEYVNMQLTQDYDSINRVVSATFN